MKPSENLNQVVQENVVIAFIDEPPFAQPDGVGGATGLDIKVALTALHAIGVKRIETFQTTFSELIPGVMAGRWDINVPLFVTPERSDVVAFSRPVWALSDGIMVAAGNPLKLNSYAHLAELPNVRVGIITGQVQQDAALRAGVLPSQIRQFETQASAVEALVNNEIDAYISTAVGNRAFLRDRRDLGLEAVLLQSSVVLDRESCYPVGAYSFSKSNKLLKTRFDMFLDRYLGSAAHMQCVASYGLSEAEIEPILSMRGACLQK